MTNDMCGLMFGPFRAWGVLVAEFPGRCPGLVSGCAFGAAWGGVRVEVTPHHEDTKSQNGDAHGQSLFAFALGASALNQPAPQGQETTAQGNALEPSRFNHLEP